MSNPTQARVDGTSMKGKVVLITGGTTGIGRETAAVLAADGAKVLVFGSTQKNLDDALAAVGPRATAGGGTIDGTIADASKQADLDRVFARLDEVGPIDVMVNNVGIANAKVFDDDFDALRRVLDVNVLSYVYCTKLAVARMRERSGNERGHVVNVGSMSADLRNPGSALYSCTKAAVQAFSESLRKAVNPEGIRVSLVEPGAVDTPMQDKPAEKKRELIEQFEMLEARDIAESVHFCLTRPPRCAVVMMQVRPLMQAI